MKTHEELRLGDLVDPKEAPSRSILIINGHLFLRGSNWIAALDGGAVEVWTNQAVYDPNRTDYRNHKDCYYLGSFNYYEYRDEVKRILNESISRKVKR